MPSVRGDLCYIGGQGNDTLNLRRLSDDVAEDLGSVPLEIEPVPLRLSMSVVGEEAPALECQLRVLEDDVLIGAVSVVDDAPQAISAPGVVGFSANSGAALFEADIEFDDFSAVQSR